jgi:Lrp/AsnC family transcriptional regulator, leucine-responsive regulatory protein
MAVESQIQLDVVDWKLLELLQEDGRLPYAELGRRVSLSPPAVAERVRRLEEAGVVTGYHASVDVAKLGFPMQAVIRIIASARMSEAVARQVLEIPEVLECQQVTGADSFVLRVAVRSVQHLEGILHRLAPQDGDTITAVVLRTPVAHRVVTRELSVG